MATLLLENRQLAHPACDLCYARKIKCDRNDPCGNCIDSKAKCLRTRPKRVGRPRQSAATGGDGKTESMINRLSRLENSVTRLATILSNGKSSAQEDAQEDGSPPKAPSPSHSQTQTGPSPAGDPKSSEDRPSKRPRLGSSTSSAAAGPKREPENDQETSLDPGTVRSEHDFTRATQFEARSFIQGALAEASQSISIDRRSVLEAALEFVGQMGHPPTRRPLMKSDKCGEEVADCIVPPAPEFFHLIFSETRRTDPRTYDLEYSTYISRSTLERMALALHEKTEDDQVLIQYAVCVNACAATYLWNLPEEGESVGMQHALERAREEYMRRALTALNYISILERPSLSVLQALLTGITLLQKLGETPTCWLLASNVCRVCVAMGLHNSQQFALPSDQLSNELRELRACFLWSYIFDKGLAMSLGRPVCMPVWDVPEDIIAPIEPDQPRSAFIQMLFKFSKIQATISCDLHYQPAQTKSPQRKEAAIASLRRQMERIRKQVDEIRAFPPHNSDAALMSEWISIDFIYHAIMTVILRFDTGVVLDAIKREECLQHARRAFVAIRNLKSHLDSCLDGQTFASFLPWTVLYYPLRPFFVLFCNVVATSHSGDFEMMKEFAETLMDLPTLNASAERLQKLCATLVTLCQPLVHQAHEKAPPSSGESHPRSNGASTNGTAESSGYPIQEQTAPSSVMPMMPPSSLGPWFQQSFLGAVATGGAGGTGGTGGTPTSVQDANGGRASSSEEMFSALFDVQPSLDWLGSDVFGQGTNWTDFDGSFNGT